MAGPKLATVLTDGRNNSSWLSARSVIDAAVRHETVIYPVAVGADSSGHPADVPPMLGNDALRLLELLAERTGGRVIHADRSRDLGPADRSRDLGPVFGALIREYWQRYILSFVPEGVARGDGGTGSRSSSGTVPERSTPGAGTGHAS